MRKLFFIILILFFTHVNAQQYTPLLVGGNEWKVAYDGFFGCETQYTECDYTLGNGVEINGLLYKELFIASLTPNAINPYNCENISETPTLFLYLREDVIEKKVYKMDLDAQNEYVFRDFSLETGDVIGDDIEITNRQFGTVFGISTRSLVMVKTLDSYPFSSNTTLFEGIGSTYGLLETQWSDFIDGFSWLISFTHNGVVSTDSQFVLVVENYFADKNLKLFYDSENKALKLTNTSGNVKIEIYSILGKNMIITEINNSLDVSELQKGIYFYTLSKNNSFKKGKILIF